MPQYGPNDDMMKTVFGVQGKNDGIFLYFILFFANYLTYKKIYFKKNSKINLKTVRIYKTSLNTIRFSHNFLSIITTNFYFPKTTPSKIPLSLITHNQAIFGCLEKSSLSHLSKISISYFSYWLQ